MSGHEIAGSPCPLCGRPNEVHRAINTEGQPDEGSVSLCWGCREPSIFQADGTLRPPTADERREILSDSDVIAIRYAMSEAYKPKDAQEMFERMTSGTRPE